MLPSGALAREVQWTAGGPLSPNWFIALPAAAEGWYETIPAPPPGLRAYHPADLHFTVAFLGAVSEAHARVAWEAVVWPLGPQEVGLGEVVPMGDPRRYSALSAVLSAGREDIERAIGECRGPALAAAGVPPDRYAPKAHVTLARPRRSATGPQRDAGLAWARALSVAHVRLTLDQIALYTWDEQRADRLFRVVEGRALSRDTPLPTTSTNVPKSRTCS